MNQTPPTKDVGFPWVRLSRTCNNTCVFCNDKKALDGGAIAREEIINRIDTLAGGKRKFIVLSGGEPTLSPNLISAIKHARGLGMKVHLVTNGRALTKPDRIHALAQAGLTDLIVSLHGATPATHDAIVGNPGAWKQSVTALNLSAALRKFQVQIRTVLTRANHHELGDVVNLAARLRVGHLDIRAEQFDKTPDDTSQQRRLSESELLNALEKAWGAAKRSGVDITTANFPPLRAPDTTRDEPEVLDFNLIRLLNSAIRLPKLNNGLRLSSDHGPTPQTLRCVTHYKNAAQLGYGFAARGIPIHELPFCMGGLGKSETPKGAGQKEPQCAECVQHESCNGISPLLSADPQTPRVMPVPHWRGHAPKPKRVAIVGLIHEISDAILHNSTLPALAESLRAAGAEAEYITARPMVWPPDKEMTVPTPPDVYEKSLREIDLSDFDTVIASDYRAGYHLVRNNRLAENARLFISDFHMLYDIDLWRNAWVEPGHHPRYEDWWPSPNIFIYSGFPGYVHLYESFGVPLRQIIWTPFPIYMGHFPHGPDPLSCEYIFSGGNHLRDLDTLTRAAEILDDGPIHPIKLLTDYENIRSTRKMTNDGFKIMSTFIDYLTNARFVIIPLHLDINRAAGITVIAMALSAGRPVICTAVPAALDYLTDGVDSILVPPGDAQALADAIARLDGDEALLSKLAAGARKSAEKLSVEHWTKIIMEGSAPTASFEHSDAERLSFRSW